MPCLFKRHTFKRIGRDLTGETLVRYVQCSRCNLVVRSIIAARKDMRFDNVSKLEFILPVIRKNEHKRSLVRAMQKDFDHATSQR